MKIFASVVTFVATNACLAFADNATSCYTPCEQDDEYCEIATGVCRGPSYDGECFNLATSAYQDGCDDGFECIDNKCDYATADDTDSDDQLEAYSHSGEDASSYEPMCLTEGCDGTREYCDSSIGECRSASNDTECYNATIALFRDGCDAGYECIDDLCRVSAEPVDGRTCHLICSAGKFCENDTTECRGPDYDGECFNLATGLFQDGCDDGYYCSFNKCVDVDLDD